MRNFKASFNLVKHCSFIIYFAFLFPSEASGAESIQTYPKFTAQKNSVPWIIAILQHNEPDNYKAQFCAATFISPYWAITAAHCVVTGSSWKDFKKIKIDILVGTQILNQGGLRATVEEDDIIFNAHYNPKNFNNDIALIRVKNPNCGQESIAIIKDESEEKQLFKNQQLSKEKKIFYVSGWGNDLKGEKEYPKTINAIDVEVMDSANCKSNYNDEYTDNMLCAGKSNFHTFCKRDSGGPLFTQYNNSNKSVQVGIISSLPNISYDPCGGDYKVAKYTRLYNYKDWIKDKSKDPYPCQNEMISTPSCPKEATCK